MSKKRTERFVSEARAVPRDTDDAQPFHLIPAGFSPDKWTITDGFAFTSCRGVG